MNPTFEEFYATYPRKKSREDARKAWGQAIAKGFTPDEIMDGLRHNLQAMRAKDPQFVPYPATWLRAGGWADEPDVGFSPPPIVQQPPRGAANVTHLNNYRSREEYLAAEMARSERSFRR